MPKVIDHLRELKRRALWVVIPSIFVLIISFIYSNSVINLILSYLDVKGTTLSPLEFINTQIKMSSSLALLFATPLFFYQFYRYIEETLPKKAKSGILVYTSLSMFLLLCGIGFALFIFIPNTFEFFKDIPDTINSMWGLSSIINYISYSLVSFGIMFQIPLIIPTLNKVGLVNVNKLKRYRALVLVFILIVAGIITPGLDVFSQLTMTIPAYALFEIGIFFSNKEKIEKLNLKGGEI